MVKSLRTARTMLPAAAMIVLSGYLGTCVGEGVLPQGPLLGAVGGSVNFTTTVSPSGTPFSSVSWNFLNASTDTSEHIITSTPTENYTGEGYSSRISLDRATGSLMLRDLTLEDSGEYTLTIVPQGQPIVGKTTLRVYEAIESVRVTNNSLPVNNENFTLTCNVTGPYDSIYWTKDNVRLNMDAEPHVDNQSLHFTPVMISDGGMYQCFATNMAGEHGSPRYQLLVIYGPLSVNITGPVPADPGHGVSLTCAADSHPHCDFSWFFDNDTSAVLETGPVITFSATEANKGNYTCKATNPLTNITMYTTSVFNGASSALCFLSRDIVILMNVFSFLVSVLFA